jgi:hypothetical protein
MKRLQIMNKAYVCSVCGESAYYDGRCGDGPILTCECDQSGRWVEDGRGGYYENSKNAQPIPTKKIRK